MYIDGIASSQAIDTAGEVVDLAGMDISSLVGAVFNYEHKSDIPAQLVGKILFAKKIFVEQDCDNDRQLKFWKSCQIPFLYCMGELFDQYNASAKEIAGVFQYDQDNQDKPPTLGFSIEGSKIAKDGMIVSRSIARKITITQASANKTCLAEAVTPEGKSDDDLSNIFKTECSTSIDFVKAEEAANILGIPMNKAEDNKQGSVLGQTGSGKNVMSHGRVGDYQGFSADDHKDAAKFHFDAAGKQTGNAKMAQHHYDKYKLHQGAFNTATAKSDRIKSAKGSAAPSSSPDPSSKNGKLFDPRLSGKVAPPKKMAKSTLEKGFVDKVKSAGKAAVKGIKAGANAVGEHAIDHLDMAINPNPNQSGYKWLSTQEKRPNRAAKLFGIKDKYADVKKAMTADSGNVAPGQATQGAALAKQDLKKEEKGVNLPPKNYAANGGQSEAGMDVRTARNPAVAKGPAKKIFEDSAKEGHKKTLSDLKAMPKPNLTKDEKGVHTAVKPKGGTSHSGAVLREQGVPAINTHKNKLRDLKAMPKPNLTKASARQDHYKVPQTMSHGDKSKVPGQKAKGTKDSLEGFASDPHKDKSTHSKALLGASSAGLFARDGKQGKDMAVKRHKETLTSLKAQPKPNLTKGQEGSTKGFPQTRGQPKGPAVGVHDEYDQRGESLAGMRGGQGKLDSTLPMSERKDMHRAKLGELKAMPKPNLTKAGMYTTDVGERIPARELQQPNLNAESKSAKKWKAGDQKKQQAGTSIGQGEEVREGNMGNAKVAAQKALNFERRLPKPKLTKSELLIRAEQEYQNWSKREEFEKFARERLPNLAKGEIIAIGQTVALNEALEAEKTLATLVNYKK